MKLLFSHSQKKSEKRHGTTNSCTIKIQEENNKLSYDASFDLTYKRYGLIKHLIFEHKFILDILNGDIEIVYSIKNEGIIEDKSYKTRTTSKTNDFQMLDDLFVNGISRGEKRYNFWGVNYKRANEKLAVVIIDKLKDNFTNPYFIKKYEKESNNNLQFFLIDYHLDRKNIKPHDNVYYHILYVYPKKKWLNKNEQKFLPSILDSLGLKKKYFISELSQSQDNINLKSLKYLCNLFGDNYIEYIKQFDWKKICEEPIQNKKLHVLKNENEKKILAKLLKLWAISDDRIDYPLNSLNKLLELRKILEAKNVKLKFDPKNLNEYDNIYEKWLMHKHHLSRGFKYRYDFPNEFINTIQNKIVVADTEFEIKILSSEDDYIIEGIMMKNCMGKQFSNGNIYIYISMKCKRKRINLQYRKGVLNQSYGKANSEVPQIFKPAIDTLNKRFNDFKDISWKKIKYDFIN